MLSPMSTSSSTDEPTPAPAEREKPFHTKRAHKKSRGGCRACKSRKIKCSEDRPRCKTCVLRNQECIYVVQESSPARAVDRTPPLAPKSPSCRPHDATAMVVSRQGPFIQPPPPTPASDPLDMKLLWFYTIRAYDSFSVESGKSAVEEVLRVTIPRLALEHPFLMDSLLTVSAQHMNALAHEDSIPHSRVMALNASAVAGYRRAVEAARPESFKALLSCSLFVCIISTETFRQPDPPPLFVLDWMIVWTGISLIYRLMSESGADPVIRPSHLPARNLGLLFTRPPVDRDRAARHVPGNLLFMVSSLRDTDPEAPYRDAYYDALKVLGALYMDLEDSWGPVLQLRTITYFTFVSRDFQQAARERRPRALVVVAHWLAFTRMCGAWWMQGLADHEVHNIDRVLRGECDGDWGPLMRVPLAAVELSDPAEVARLLLNNHSFEPVRREIHELPVHKRPALLMGTGEPLNNVMSNSLAVRSDGAADGC